MTGLTLLGVFCILLACFGGVLTLVTEHFKKPSPTKIGTNGKRELKLNRISLWDYLILILPASLLLIGLLSSNSEERLLSLNFLWIGYSLLIVSSYNRRIDIPKINWFLCATCIVIAAVGFFLGRNFKTQILPADSYIHISLYYPLFVYCFIHLFRQIIKFITGTYPITLDKYYRVGAYHYRYNRRANYWDLAWSLISTFLFLGLLIFLGTKPFD